MKKEILMVARVYKLTNPDGSIMLYLEIPQEEGSNSLKMFATGDCFEGITNDFLDAMETYIPKNWRDN